MVPRHGFFGGPFFAKQMVQARPYIGGSDTRRFVYILRGLLCDVIGRLAPRAPVG